MIDVGQGLAVAVRGPEGGLLLVDAGGSASGRYDPGERVVLPFLLGRGARRIEALIVTHGDVFVIKDTIETLCATMLQTIMVMPASESRPAG